LKPREENNDMAAENSVPKEEKSFAGSQSFEALGFTAVDLTSEEKSKLSVDGGVKIVDVKTYSEGFDRGLREGLVIVEADKQQISDIGDLNSILSSKNKGDIVVLKVKTSDKSTRLVALEVK
jgi:serine protease Do